jgi:hypothetical protein
VITSITTTTTTEREIIMTDQRTDVHRPSSPHFDPEAYNLLGVFDLSPEWPTGERQMRMEIINHWIAQGYSFAGAPHSHGQCDHCGAHIRYEALTAHAPTRTLIEFGETCLDNRLGHTADSFRQLRKDAAARSAATRERNRLHGLAAEIEEWLAEQDPRLVELTYVDNGGAVDSSEFLTSLAASLYRYGSLSERQADFGAIAVTRDADRRAEWERRDREDAARKAAAGPAPEGRVRVVGTVEHTWIKDSDFGLVAKWRVRADEGWIVIVSIPAPLRDEHEHEELRGHRVAFTATLRRSDDDETVAWGSRPIKGTLVDSAAAALATV